MTETIAVRDRTRTRSVYFVQAVDGGPIKIGAAFDVARRVDGLQVGSPQALHVLAVLPGVGTAFEAELHAQFAAERLQGEWFRPSARLRSYIATIKTVDVGLLAGDPTALDEVWRLGPTQRVRARYATRTDVLRWLDTPRVASAVERDRRTAAELLVYMPDDLTTVETAVESRKVARGESS